MVWLDRVKPYMCVTKARLMTAVELTTTPLMSERILNAAQRMTERLGYGGLSFRDIAAAVGIKSSSVHYHFPTKGDLGAAVARRYTEAMIAALDGESDPAAAIDRYVGLIRGQLHDGGRMCLCGMLAAEIDALPEAVRAEVRHFIGVNVTWLSSMLSPPGGDARTMEPRAHAIFAALEGAMLIARGTGDLARFDIMVDEYRRAGLFALA